MNKMTDREIIREMCERILYLYGDDDGDLSNQALREVYDIGINALCEPPPNAAVLFDAVRKTNEFFRFSDENKPRLIHLCLEADKATRIALATPPRNVDFYNNAKDALDAFIREKEIKEEDVDNMNLRDFFDWLFEPVKKHDK